MSPMPTDTTEKEMESAIVRNLHPISSIIFNPRPVLEFPGQSLLRSFLLASEQAIGVSLKDSGLAETTWNAFKQDYILLMHT